MLACSPDNLLLYFYHIGIVVELSWGVLFGSFGILIRDVFYWYSSYLSPVSICSLVFLYKLVNTVDKKITKKQDKVKKLSRSKGEEFVFVYGLNVPGKTYKKSKKYYSILFKRVWRRKSGVWCIVFLKTWQLLEEFRLWESVFIVIHHKLHVLFGFWC